MKNLSEEKRKLFADQLKKSEKFLTTFENKVFMIIAKSNPTPFKTEFTNNTVHSYSDNTPKKGGSGDGFRPHELLEAALACCINMSARMYAKKNSISLDNVKIVVAIDRSISGKVCFEYEVKLGGNLSKQQKSEILEVIKSCPVHKTLSSELSFKVKDS